MQHGQHKYCPHSTGDETHSITIHQTAAGRAEVNSRLILTVPMPSIPGTAYLKDPDAPQRVSAPPPPPPPLPPHTRTCTHISLSHAKAESPAYANMKLFCLQNPTPNLPRLTPSTTTHPLPTLRSLTRPCPPPTPHTAHHHNRLALPAHSQCRAGHAGRAELLDPRGSLLIARAVDEHDLPLQQAVVIRMTLVIHLSTISPTSIGHLLLSCAPSALLLLPAS